MALTDTMFVASMRVKIHIYLFQKLQKSNSFSTWDSVIYGVLHRIYKLLKTVKLKCLRGTCTPHEERDSCVKQGGGVDVLNIANLTTSF